MTVVCAFCHTPHHAYQGTNPTNYYPLWSRTLDVQNFTPYRSATINAIDWAADIAIGPTRLCMSCHDGTIALDQHYGKSAYDKSSPKTFRPCWILAGRCSVGAAGKASPTTIRSASTTTPSPPGLLPASTRRWARIDYTARQQRPLDPGGRRRDLVYRAIPPASRLPTVSTPTRPTGPGT